MTLKPGAAWIVVCGAMLVTTGYLTARPSAQAGAAPSSAPVSRGLTPTDSLRPVLDRYCITCHNQRLKTAGLVLDGFDVSRVGGEAETWEKVARKLRTREMPPPGLPRPDAEMYDRLASTLESALDVAAAARPNPGRVIVQRIGELTGPR